MEAFISNIVFSKNRALQLDGYLASLYRYFPPEYIQTYILYQQQLFDEQYQQVFSEYSDCKVVKEEDFFSDFLNIINKVNTKYILFGVDDIVYFDSVDFEVIDKTFDAFKADIFGFSLRFSYEYIQKSGDIITETHVDGQKLYSIDWTVGETPTTRYPFELCATIYKTELVKNIIYNVQNHNHVIRKFFSPRSYCINMLKGTKLKHKILKKFGFFYAPNPLESWLCKWCQQNSALLPKKLFFKKTCASAIQVNMVNVTTRDEGDKTSEFSVKRLAEKFVKGYRFDIDFLFENKPTETHSGPEYFKLINNRKNGKYT